MPSYSSLTFQSFQNAEQPILPLGSYTGRVNIKDPVDPKAVFKMQAQIAAKNTASNYYEALTGTWEANALAQVFFSKDNMQILQNGLRAGVYEKSKGTIVLPPQNVDALKIIMRSTYMQFALHHAEDVRGQVERLNKLVLDYIVPTLYSDAISYLKYVEDQSTLVQPLAKPLPVDRVYKQLELKRYF